jgi:hypothetical protein
MKSATKCINFSHNSSSSAQTCADVTAVVEKQLQSMPDLENDKLKSIHRSVSSSSLTAKSRKRKQHQHARQWSMLIETLKKTIDCIYEFCRLDQSVIECKVDLI